MTGLSDLGLRSCTELFEAGGWQAIQPAPRGRSTGTGRTLIDNRPEPLKMNFSLEPGRLRPADRAGERHQIARA